MSGKWFLIVVILVILGMLLGACQTVGADSGFETEIKFQQELNQDQIGSFFTMYQDGSFNDFKRDEWKNSIDLMFDFEKCIVPEEGSTTVFFSQWEKNWFWTEKTNIWGQNCWYLKKY